MKNVQKLDALKFALAGGILAGVMVGLITVLSLLNVPGYSAFANMLVSIYGSYGYSISVVGILTGAVLGFLEVFVQLGLLALLYNKLLER